MSIYQIIVPGASFESFDCGCRATDRPWVLRTRVNTIPTLWAMFAIQTLAFLCELVVYTAPPTCRADIAQVKRGQ
jgi:hypothetical protein